MAGNKDMTEEIRELLDRIGLDDEQIDRWLAAANKHFRDQTPQEFIDSGRAEEVRNYLRVFVSWGIGG